MKLRMVSLTAAVLALPPAALAQAPDLGRDLSATVKVHVELKSGGRTEVRQPDIIDNKLCGWIVDSVAPADAAPKAGCIAKSDITSTRVEGAKYALGESTEGSLCMVLMPLCLAKVAAVQNRIVERVIEKAQKR
jgi:hypothetical protein